MKKVYKNSSFCLFVLVLLLLFFVGCSAAPSRSVPGGNEPPKKPPVTEDPVVENVKQSSYYKFNPSGWESVKESSLPSDGSVDISWYENNWELNQFEISNEAELRGLAWLVNNNIDDFFGKTVKLTQDITLTSFWIPIGEGNPMYTVGNFEKNNLLDFSGKAVEAVWEENADVVYRFSGIFDGNGKTISGLTNKNSQGENAYPMPAYSKILNNKIEGISKTAMSFAYGLFGLVQGTLNNEDVIVGGIIKNLKMDNVDIDFSGLYIEEVTDENYSAQIKSIGVGYLGSVVGACINNAQLENIEVVSGQNKYYREDKNPTVHSGGIAGYFRNKQTLDTNEKALEPTNNENSFFKIKNCKNAGVTVDGYNYVGGILGYMYGNYYGELLIYDTENNAKIGSIINEGTGKSLSSHCGGVVGYGSSIARLGLVRVKNTADINASSYVGGLISYTSGKVRKDSEASVLVDCFNSGDVCGVTNVGGIAGYLGCYRDVYDRSIYISNLHSTGNVTIFNNGCYGGGLLGQLDYYQTADIKDCSVGSRENGIVVNFDAPDASPSSGHMVGGLIGLFDRGVSISLTNIEININDLDLAVPYILTTNGVETVYPCSSGLVIGSLYNLSNIEQKVYYDFKNVKVFVESETEDQVAQIRTIGNKLRKTENTIFSQYFTDNGESNLTFDDSSTVTFLNVTPKAGGASFSKEVKLSDIKYEAVPNPVPAE